MIQMQQEINKLERFRQSILRDADEQCRVIREQTRQEQEEALGKYKGGARGDFDQLLRAQQSKLELDAAHALALCKNDLKRALYQRRSMLCDEVFTRARERLIAFTHSDDYLEFLNAQVKKAVSIAAGGTLTLLVRAEDVVYAPQLQQAAGTACAVEADPEISVGGLIARMERTGARMDETLDTRLEQQRDWFYGHAGIFVK